MKRDKIILDPNDDGETHINVYSKGRTELGRVLTNFAETPFDHTEYGKFNSVEGLWYWVLTGKVYEEFRELSGFPAKRLGKEVLNKNKDIVKIDKDSDVFKNDIKEGIRCKLRQNKNIVKEMVKTDLPFVHYYWRGSLDNFEIKKMDKYDWIMDELEEIRAKTKVWLSNKNRFRF